MKRLHRKSNEEIDVCIKAQADYCEKKKQPHFAPKNGRCWRCNRNIYQNFGVGIDKPYSRTIVEQEGAEVEFITGISLEEASHQLVIGCPHCNWSFCE